MGWFDSISHAINNTVKSVDHSASSVFNKAKNTGESVFNKAKNSGESVFNKVKSTANKGLNQVQNAGNQVANGAVNVLNKSAGIAGSINKWTTNPYLQTALGAASMVPGLDVVAGPALALTESVAAASAAAKSGAKNASSLTRQTQSAGNSAINDARTAVNNKYGIHYA